MSGRSRARGASLMFGLALVSWLAAPLGAEERAPWLDAIDRGLGDLVSPRALARAHAELSAISQCSECHDGLRATPDERCLDCHEDVAERKQERIGWHAQLEGACSDCHADHRGAEADILGLDRDSWNHELARFPLRGAHVGVACDDCHEREGQGGKRGFHAQGIGFERCADCHDDVHGRDFLVERDCGVCHSDRGFRADALAEAGFEHARDTGFALEGAHEKVSCAGCHTAERRSAEQAERRGPGSSAPRDCAGCHEDPHNAALGADCASCHTTVRWDEKGRAARFDHTRDTRFALDALHTRLDCAACHEGLRFEARGRACADCHTDAVAFLAGDALGAHAAADPHAGALECRECHPATVADPSLLDYERVCLTCHPAPYASLLATKKRLVDENVVKVEAVLFARAVARRLGDSPASPSGESAAAAQVAVIERSGLHNAGLSEAALLALLESLSSTEVSE